MANYTYKQTLKTLDLFEFEVTIDYKIFQEELNKSINSLAKNVKVSGFRPGKAPKSMVASKVSNDALNDTINKLLPDTTYKILVDEKLNPITTPEYEVLSLSEKDGVKYKFSFTNYPEINLPDFSKIKVEKKKAEATNDDADSVIRNIIKSSLPKEKWKVKIAETKKETKKTSKKESVEENFPLTDGLIEELNYEGAKTLDSMRETIKKRLIEIKQENLDKEYVNEIVKQAAKLSNIELPKVLVDNEVHNMMHNFEHRVKDLGLELNEYLKSQGITLEQKQEEWAETAKERIINDLLLITLATKEKITATDEEIQKEIDAITDPALKAEYNNVNGRNYIRTVLTKQKGALKLLEIVEGKTKK